MKFTDTTKRALKALMKLPRFADVELTIEERDGMAVVAITGATTQTQVRRARTLFPGTLWSKREQYGYWSYSGAARLPLGFGRSLAIIAEVRGCLEAPPTCRQIEVTEEIEQWVPVDDDGKPIVVEETVKHAYVKQPTRVRKWVCGDGYEDPKGGLPVVPGDDPVSANDDSSQKSTIADIPF